MKGPWQATFAFKSPENRVGLSPARRLPEDVRTVPLSYHPTVCFQTLSASQPKFGISGKGKS